MSRRLFACLFALALSGALAAVAAASPQDVINDLKDGNPRIERCHDKVDYDAAQNSLEPAEYGDELERIDEALGDPSLVGTADKPCPDTVEDSDGSGVGAAALIGIPAAILLLIGAVIAARRRRDDDGEGE